MKTAHFFAVSALFLSFAAHSQEEPLYFVGHGWGELVPLTPTSAKELNKVVPEFSKCTNNPKEKDPINGQNVCIYGHKQQTTSKFDEKTLTQTVITKRREFYRKYIDGWFEKGHYSEKIWFPLQVIKTENVLEKYVKVPSVKRKLVCSGTVELRGSSECRGHSETDNVMSEGYGTNMKINYSKVVTLTDEKNLNQGKVVFRVNFGGSLEQVDSYYRYLQAKNPTCQIRVYPKERAVYLTYIPSTKTHELDVLGKDKKNVQPNQVVNGYIDDGREADVDCHFELL